MTLSFQELANYMAVILSWTVALVVIRFSKGRSFVKIGLAFALIVSATSLFIGTLMYSGKVVHLPFLMRMDSPFDYLIGPACYFYTLATFKPDFKFKPIHLLHLLPFTVNLFEFLPFYLSSNEAKIAYYTQYYGQHDSLTMPIHYFTKGISAVLYFSLQIAIFFSIKRRKNRSSDQRRFINWFYFFFLGQGFLISMLVLDNLTGKHLFGDSYIFSKSMIAFFLFATTFSLIFFPSLLYGYTPIKEDKKIKYHYSTLTEQEKDTILNSLNAYLSSSGKPYLNPDLSVKDISEHLHVSHQHLSQTINEKTNQSFSDFINHFRVEEVKDLLTCPNNKNLTIEAISQKAGFSSKSQFYSAFKQQTGLTPKAFLSEKTKTAVV
jgi:AraC-like DNA-binding protein